jgi:hypothetical protein
MAQRRDLDFTYSLTDRIVRLSLGELADFSGAKYDGDVSANRICFERELLDHFRLVFEKAPSAGS